MPNGITLTMGGAQGRPLCLCFKGESRQCTGESQGKNEAQGIENFRSSRKEIRGFYDPPRRLLGQQLGPYNRPTGGRGNYCGAVHGSMYDRIR